MTGFAAGYGTGHGLDPYYLGDYNRDLQKTKRVVRDLLQAMIDDAEQNGMLDDSSTEDFKAIIYRLMDQV